MDNVQFCFDSEENKLYAVVNGKEHCPSPQFYKEVEWGLALALKALDRAWDEILRLENKVEELEMRGASDEIKLYAEQLAELAEKLQEAAE